MSAREKKDELWKAGLARPRCDCHSEPMCWSSEARLAGGGRWRCAVRERERRARQRRAYPERDRAAVERWRRGESGYVGADERPTHSASYNSAHQRVVHERGRASEHPCVDCGGQAREWSYIGGDPDERVSTTKSGAEMTYSLDPAYYSPRCVRCHRRFDA